MAWLAASLSGLALAMSSAPEDDARYWRVIDQVDQQVAASWDGARGYYALGFGGIEVTGNANLLLTHAVAALRGHRGAARQDERARRIVDALLASPPYVLQPASGTLRGFPHAPGWSGSMRWTAAYQHQAIDCEVAEALAFTWLARDELRLTESARASIRARVSAVALSRFWRWPAITLNQINWPACMYSAFATVSGNRSLLRRDLRRQIARFVDRAATPRRRAGNLGPGMQFHYSPNRSSADALNVDSAEYGSIVASFARFYSVARRGGMSAPGPAGRRLVRAWLRRVLAGYWTHAGYLNWDTGWGFRRWHQASKFGFAQQALIGLAAGRGLASPRLRAWANWMLDRSFAFHERQAARTPEGVLPNALYGMSFKPAVPGYGRLASARVAANAARAVAAGLGAARRRRPPPLYAFDPDTGRLAVTTPAYNTAIVPITQGAFPYGGIELARLYDADQEVAANIGGRPPASFGLLARDATGARLLVTQSPRALHLGRRAPLRLTRAPAGVGARPDPSTPRAYAGPFEDLRAAARARGDGVKARVTHRFTDRFIQSRWSLRSRAGRRSSVDVLFPSFGHGARINAVGPDGSDVPVRHGRRTIDDVAYFHVRSLRSGYVVVPRGVPARATSRAIRTADQPSAPNAGPILAIELARRRTFRRVAFVVRVAPVRAGEDPDPVARRLAWNPGQRPRQGRRISSFE